MRRYCKVVWNVSRGEHGVAGTSLEPRIANPVGNFSFQNVEQLILAGVNMERHLEVWRVQKLNQRESAFRLFACELYQRQTAEPPPCFESRCLSK